MGGEYHRRLDESVAMIVAFITEAAPVQCILTCIGNSSKLPPIAGGIKRSGS